MKKFIKGVRFTPSNYPDEIEDKIQKYRKQGYKLPPRKVLRTPEQIEGIRESAKINTALLNHIHRRDRSFGLRFHHVPWGYSGSSKL